MRSHYTPISVAGIQNPDTTKCCLGRGAPPLGGTPTVPPREGHVAVSHKAKHTLPTQFSNHMPQYSPEGTEHVVPTKPCTRCLQQLYPELPDLESNQDVLRRWMNRRGWPTQTTGYSALKTSEQSSHGKAWRDLKCKLLGERSQPEKSMYCVISTIWHSGKGKTMQPVESPAVCRD